MPVLAKLHVGQDIRWELPFVVPDLPRIPYNPRWETCGVQLISENKRPTKTPVPVPEHVPEEETSAGIRQAPSPGL